MRGEMVTHKRTFQKQSNTYVLFGHSGNKKRKMQMNIKITIKQLGKKRSKITDRDFTLEHRPETVEQLIKEAVYTCVREHNAVTENGDTNPNPLTNAQIADMSEIGKIAFGIHYNEKRADKEQAVMVAIQAFEDGLVRIFKGEEELLELNQAITIQENELLTFIRLTMLSGSMY